MSIGKPESPRHSAPLAPAPLAPVAPVALLAPTLFYLALSLAWSWPLPLHLASRFTHDPGDPLLVTYLIWWNAHAVPLTQAWWNAAFYWPMHDALALTEHLAGVSPFTTPVQWLGGSPLLAYNLLLIASTWWSGLATHALVRWLTQRDAAAYCAGVAFALAPYRVSQVGHLQLFACWWLPVTLLALHRFHADGRLRWLGLFGLAWLLQGLTTGYYLFFSPFVIAAWLAWFTRTRADARRGALVAIAWVLFTLPMLPVLLEYYRVQSSLGLSRSPDEMLSYSAHWGDFVSTSPLLRVWHLREPSNTELYLFPGVTAIFLALAGAAAGAWRDRRFVFYVGLAALLTWLCAGPAADRQSLAALWHPYGWFSWWPGFTGLRVPARFFMLASLCLAVAAGLAVGWLQQRWSRLGRVIGLAVAGLIADGAIAGMPLGVPPGALLLQERNARVLELPFSDGRVSVWAMYKSMAHRLPVINGYAGYIPPHAVVLDWALSRHDASVLTELRRGRPLYVLVASSNQEDEWTRFMSEQDATMISVTGGGRLYRMDAIPLARDARAGAPLDVVSATVDGPWVVLDVGSARVGQVVEVRPGRLSRMPRWLRVEASIDGVTWTLASEQPAGGATLIGALTSPRVWPVRLVIPDVRARYFRVNVAPYGPRAVTVFSP
jgi:hypothetical protein